MLKPGRTPPRHFPDHFYILSTTIKRTSNKTKQDSVARDKARCQPNMRNFRQSGDVFFYLDYVTLCVLQPHARVVKMWNFLAGVSKPKPLPKKRNLTEEEDEKTGDKSKRCKSFNPAWLQEFEWLEFKAGEMNCRPCRLFNGDPLSGRTESGKPSISLFAPFVLI